MKGFRVSILDVMTLVVIAAVDFAIIKLLMRSHIIIGPLDTTQVDLTLFSFGVLPLASLLIFFWLILIPRRMRSNTPSSFFAGFQCFGWRAIFLFIALSALRSEWVIDFALAIRSKVPPGARPFWDPAPEWIGAPIEFVFCTIVLTTPELIIALFGGWLTRKLGITILIERRRKIVAPLESLDNTFVKT